MFWQVALMWAARESEEARLAGLGEVASVIRQVVRL